MSEEEVFEVEEWADFSMMMVAHATLLRYKPALLRARLQRCFERQCRRNLLHVVQYMGLQPAQPPEVQPSLDADVIAAFAAFEPLVAGAISRMTLQNRDEVLKGVADLVFNTHSQPRTYHYWSGSEGWDWCSEESCSDTAALRPHARHDFIALELPEPTQRSSLKYKKPKGCTRHRQCFGATRGAVRQSLCITDFEVC